MRTITIDLSKNCGEIKPLHGVNGGPCSNLASGSRCINHIEDFKNAGIPYSRLHDIEGAYGGTYFVDVPNIFRDFDRDPEDPDAYDFDLTDEYIKYIYEAGTQAFYRLGTTIDHANIKKRAIMPADFLKWAKICEGIIKHYNEGWANGFHYDIKYWEIWNEPDNGRKPNPQWSGTFEEYCRFYEVSTNYLKDRFPYIKLGGFGGTLVPNTRGGEMSATSVIRFLNYITSPEHKAPLDFLDLHLYGMDPDEYGAVAFDAKKVLEEYGLTKTEIIIGEYNFAWGVRGPEFVKSMRSAACASAFLSVMQKAPVSKAMYYFAQPRTMSYCGLFSYPQYGVEKPYYSFLAFNELYKLKNEVYSSSDETNVYTCAAFDGKKGAILITRYDIEDLMLKPSYIVRADGCPELSNKSDEVYTLDVLEKNERISLPLNMFIDIKGIPSGYKLKIEYYWLDEENNLTPARKKIYKEDVHPEIIRINSQSTLLVKMELEVEDIKEANRKEELKAVGLGE